MIRKPTALAAIGLASAAQMVAAEPRARAGAGSSMREVLLGGFRRPPSCSVDETGKPTTGKAVFYRLCRRKARLPHH